jgi:hypothetical protein
MQSGEKFEPTYSCSTKKWPAKSHDYVCSGPINSNTEVLIGFLEAKWMTDTNPVSVTVLTASAMGLDKNELRTRWLFCQCDRVGFQSFSSTNTASSETKER